MDGHTKRMRHRILIGVRIAVAFAVGMISTAPPSLAGSDQSIPVRIEPPQPINAITLRNGDDVQSVDIVDGKALVPTELPLPWTLGLNRFEPLAYTRDDLAKGNTLVLRELGVLRGTLRRPSPKSDESFTVLLRVSNTDKVQPMDVTVSADGAFSIRVPAGIYEGAAIGTATATRIRSGIVIQPGKPTDLGTLECQPAVPVSLRVLDAKTGTPLPNATVTWDPPAVLNADAARVLYAKRWSASTDLRGVARFSAVGPLPIPVRWRMEAKGYSSQWATRQITENERITLPDVRLRPAPSLVVRVHLPATRRDLDGAGIVAAIQDPSTHHFTPATGAPLREGQIRLALPGYGKARVLVKSATGAPLLYQDFDVDSESLPVDLTLEPLEIHGRVTRRDQPARGIYVYLSDPEDARVQLAKAPVDDDGGYSLSTYQSGDLYLHTVSRGGEGLSVGSVSKRLTAGGRDEYRVDFELPALGAVLRVIDAASGAPLRATVEQQIELQDGTTYFRQGETNAAGRLELSGYSAGLARLQVHAKSHRAHSIEIPLQDNPEDTIVALERSGSITGRVVDAFGAPIRGARITGGYASETEMNGAFIAATGANGRFSFDSAPDLGTMFYIAAPRHALAITSLHEGENVIVLQPPGSGVVTLRPDNAMPANTYLVLAAPAGGTMIPFGALQDLADVNGMSAYQMQGSQKDGSIVLPQFLGPGKYELFIALQGGKPFLYRRIGTITSPVQQNVVLAYDSK